MDVKQFESRLEGLAEAHILADPGDPKALAALHGHFDSLLALLVEHPSDTARMATVATMDLLERLILEEIDNRQATMDVIGQTLNAL
ncbi:MAG: hypothetical protein IT440_12055, partial [Phycisphaeraceae bacterium]|nr:hypothetical protein [Phycisphaeraceae bacterium]